MKKIIFLVVILVAISPPPQISANAFPIMESEYAATVDVFSLMSEQNYGITKMEYWFDNNAVHYVKPLSLSENYNWIDSLSTGVISDGLHVAHTRFYDKTGSWSSVNSTFFIKNKSEVILNPDIARLEYWVDGNSSSKTLKTITPTGNYQWLDSLDVTGVREGLHVGHVRFCDKTGKWSSVSSVFFLKKLTEIIPNPVVTKMEYWVDGNTNKRNLKAVTPSTVYQWLDSLDVSNQKDGLHVGHVRFADQLGKWSDVLSVFFMKMNPDIIANPVLTKMEYWTDSNYKDKTVKTITSAANYQWFDSLDVVALRDGLHVIHSRFFDQTGKWSNISSTFVLKNNSGIIPNPTLEKMEYWIDNNRNATIQKQLASLSNAYQWLDSISVNALVGGVHAIHVRFCDKKGEWSSVQSNYIEQRDFAGKDNRITTYRYWFDIEPNYRPTVQKNAIQPVITIIDSLDVAQLPKGNQVMYYQFKDAQGRWSSVLTDTVSQSETPRFTFVTDNQQLCDSGKVKFTNDSIFVKRLEWKFGDLNNGAGINPTHLYNELGTFDITATVWFKGGTDSLVYTKPSFIRVHPSAHSQSNNNIVYGDSIQYGGIWHKLSGQYTLNLQTHYGCDSICILNLSLTKAQLIVTANDTTRDVNKNNPIFRLSYAGFMFNEDPSVLNVVPMATTDATTSSPKGVYDILVSGGSDDHYSFVYEAGRFTILDPNGLKDVDAYRILLYPNPVRAYLSIRSDMAVMKHISIIDADGRIVRQKDCIGSPTEYINLESLSKGLYLISIITDRGQIIGKIVKE